MTVWSPEQEAALDKARRWIDAPRGSVPQVFKLEGYAGTGKTTIARELYEHAGRVAACAYTGKAASVMAGKGLSNASTAHRLIYTPIGNDSEAKLEEMRREIGVLCEVPDPNRETLLRIEALRRQIDLLAPEAGKPKFVLKDRDALAGVDLILLDEHTNINDPMGEDMLSMGIKVLALGDPAQLPPVRGTGFFSRFPTDVTLTEVHRQARDSAIIMLATAVREGRSLSYGEWSDARVVRSIGAETALAADQILCGTNARRRAINMRHRQLAGHDYRADPMPRDGERLVCLKNDHEIGLLNGTLWDQVGDTDWQPGDTDVYLTVRPDTGGDTMSLPAEASIFIDEDQKPKWGGSQWFSYGYCLTVHKSQGSQWDNVVLFNDWPGRQSRKEWLYTGITRAAEDLTIVQD